MQDTVEKNKYQYGKIYQLYCNDNYYYIGSTITELRFRLRDHKQASKQFPDRKVYKHILEVGWNNVKIECLEEYPCNSFEELRQKENEYIQATISDEFCLNNIMAYLTEQELKENQIYYRQKHRDTILDYKKQYREENANKIREYNKNYVEENSELVKQRKKKYNEAHKDKISEQCKKYNEAHKEEIAALKKQYAETHKDELKQKSKDYRTANAETISEKGKQYYEQNKEACQERMRQYQKENAEMLKQKAKERREKKKLVNPDVSLNCTLCGGSYQAYRKSRHDASKKHTDALNMSCS